MAMDYSIYGSDKETTHRYFTEVYEKLFEHLIETPVRILELGLWTGGCLRMWQDFFRHPDVVIVGIDHQPIDPSIPDGKNLFYHQGNQLDQPFLEGLSAQYGPWDVVIDDASHRGHETMSSLYSLWKAVKPGGIYVVEDIYYGWPHAHDRLNDGDEKIREVPLKLIEFLPEFGIRKLHIDYRRNSGLLWIQKEDNPEFIQDSGVPKLNFSSV